jgi:hypothetical protein
MERNFLIRLLHWLSKRFDRYKFLLCTCNPVAGHSMKMLAGKLEAAAGGSKGGFDRDPEG